MFQHFVQNMLGRLTALFQPHKDFLATPGKVCAGHNSAICIFYLKLWQGNTLQHIPQLCFPKAQSFVMFLFVLHNDCLFPGELVSVWQAVGGDDPVCAWNQRQFQSISFPGSVCKIQGSIFVSNKTSNGPVLVIIPLGTLFLFQVKSCAPFLLFQNRYKLAFIPVLHYMASRI